MAGTIEGKSGVFSYSNAVRGAIISGVIVLCIDRGYEFANRKSEPSKPVIMTNRNADFHTEVHIFREDAQAESTVTVGKNSYFLRWTTRKGLTGSGSLICYSLGADGAVSKGKFRIDDDFTKNQLVLEATFNGGQRVVRPLTPSE